MTGIFQPRKIFLITHKIFSLLVIEAGRTGNVLSVFSKIESNGWSWSLVVAWGPPRFPVPETGQSCGWWESLVSSLTWTHSFLWVVRSKQLCFGSCGFPPLLFLLFKQKAQGIRLYHQFKLLLAFSLFHLFSVFCLFDFGFVLFWPG